MTSAEIRQLFRDDPLDEPRQTENALDFAENNCDKFVSPAVLAAKAKKVCRICGKPESAPFAYNFGSEFAHLYCLIDEGELLRPNQKNGDGIHDFATEPPALNVGDEVLIVIPGRETPLQRIKGLMVLTCFVIALGCAVLAVLNAPPEQVALTSCILFLCGASVIERL